LGRIRGCHFLAYCAAGCANAAGAAKSKIDGEFIRNLPASTTDQLILRSIVQMANGLGKRTIAEFVGNNETLELVREHGVHYAQGYHVGRPRPLTELRAPVQAGSTRQEDPAGRRRRASDLPVTQAGV
jgi:EAL domain-containing protein (putative c-di-GMP-specific phosphodiesterase class I)